MINDNRRNQIIDIINREFVGPDPIKKEGMIQEDGEEILSSDPPRIRYSAGILFPQSTLPADADDMENEEINVPIEDEFAPDEVIVENEEKRFKKAEWLSDAEEFLNLSNAFHQSAVSMTVAVKNDTNVSVIVKAGTYKAIQFEDARNEKKSSHYFRKPLRWDNDGRFIVLPNINERIKRFVVTNAKEKTNLTFAITYRYFDNKCNSTIYTFTLENTKMIGDASIKDEDCYFQIEFSLFAEDGFAYLPDNQRINVNDEDYQSNQLLYRNVKNYAIGHGCSADWKESNGKVFEIHTAIFPSYEIKPIVPNTIPGVSLEMFKMSDFGDFDATISELNKMCEYYLDWIRKIKIKSESLEEKYISAAKRNIISCEMCYSRMVDGVYLLKTDKKVRTAFQYMNRAMLLQQLHYSLPLQEWNDNGHGDIELDEKYENLPDINVPDTWYDHLNRKYGIWRPFQIAFILMNLKSMSDKNCSERKDVDLIWFPTGGGKTEAYLGLSAFTIFIRRLNNLEDTGTVILMRYTLRLLTAQQYERAAAMICACELIRKEKLNELGTERITIGLWVGEDSTPNKMTDALKSYEALYNGKSDENPFVILKCPWCGAQMGVVQINNKRERRLPGYKKFVGKTKEIIFQCNNNKCDFSHNTCTLPLLMVDDAIYKNPPTLLIGTVDKFAMLPFKPEAQKLFGIYGTERITPPELIIQDELHLISGPLGSMVGHYETMINELCIDKRSGKKIGPKVIASTATISRAKEQCNALYNCSKDRVIQFPPSGIDAGDSFFAIENSDGVGRLYVGILAPASSSYSTTNIRLYAALLYAAKSLVVNDEKERDPYWTNVGYFNSIRELGQTATWVSADIDEYLHTIYKRRHEDQDEGYKDNRRYIYRFEELTSRIQSDKIPMSLQNLEITYPSLQEEKRPVDICLATNMISVGVDVSRLGLMTVTGQPKTTSEYIQATSRVGRAVNAPGIIFTSYSPAKPRDKSHYEQFRSYHSKIYSHVEPTSVTPFSAPLRDRALHALLIGLFRLTGTEDIYDDPQIMPEGKTLENILSVIKERVKGTDSGELNNTLKQLDEIIVSWKNWSPQKYSDFRSEPVQPLMYQAGAKPNPEWEKRGFPTPTSMRSVDASCEVYVLPNGYHQEDI